MRPSGRNEMTFCQSGSQEGVGGSGGRRAQGHEQTLQLYCLYCTREEFFGNGGRVRVKLNRLLSALKAPASVDCQTGRNLCLLFRI